MLAKVRTSLTTAVICIQHIAELWDMTRSRFAGLANPSGFRLRHGHIVRMAIKGEEPVISDNYHKSGTGTFECWVTFEEASTGRDSSLSHMHDVACGVTSQCHLNLYLRTSLFFFCLRVEKVDWHLLIWELIFNSFQATIHQI